jgi:putative tricarboxylic transport membrane protein
VFPTVSILCIAGSYAVQNSLFDVKTMLFFGVIGYFMRKFAFPIPPFLIAFILGPMVEDRLRQSLIIAGGSPSIFFTSPISLTFVSITLCVIFAMIWKNVKASPMIT